MKLDYKAKKRSLWFKKKSFEVMNTVSRVAPGCNFFFERERMKVLMSQGTSARLFHPAVLGERRVCQEIQDV